MAAFSYRAYDENGSPVSGVVEAVDYKEASRQLIQARKKPFEIVEAKSRRQTGDTSGIGQALRRRGDLTKLFSELSVLLNAGFNAPAALKIIATSERSKGRRALLSAISDQLSNGRALSEAFGEIPNMPPEVAALVRSGEMSGKLAEVIARMAETYRFRAERRAAIIEALIYPAFLVLMMIGAFLFLAFFLMPAIEPVFESGSVEKPLIVAMLSSFGRFVSDTWIFILAAAVATRLALALLIRRRFLNATLSRIMFRFPLIGPLRREMVAARYLDTLSMLTGNGVAFTESMKLASATSSAPEIAGRLEIVRNEIADGGRLQNALDRTGIFDGPTLTLVGLGEESNNLPVLLKRAAALLEARTKRKIDRFVVFLTPAVTITLGLFIGTLVVSVMTALLSINEIAIQ